MNKESNININPHNHQELGSLTTHLESMLDKFFLMHEGQDPESGLYDRIIKEVELTLFRKTMEYSGSVQTKAAKILGINRNTLRKKIHDFKIT